METITLGGRSNVPSSCKAVCPSSLWGTAESCPDWQHWCPCGMGCEAGAGCEWQPEACAWNRGSCPHKRLAVASNSRVQMKNLEEVCIGTTRNNSKLRSDDFHPQLFGQALADLLRQTVVHMARADFRGVD